jgi:hypothetical protein
MHPLRPSRENDPLAAQLPAYSETWGVPVGAWAFLDKSYDRLFAALLFVTIFLPAGSVYGFNFKYPIYVLLLPASVVALFRRRRATRAHLALLLLAPMMLILWSGISMVYGFQPPTILRQANDILLMLLLCWLACLFYGIDEERQIRFLLMVVNASVATALLKIGAITYALARGIPVVEMVLWIDRVFDVDLMSMDLGSLFGRLQFVADEVIPICIFVLLRHRGRLRFGSMRASLSILVLIVSVVISFSRYFWGFTAFALLLGLILSKRDLFKAVLFTIVGVSTIAALPVLVSLYELRFSTGVAGGSDIQRTEQMEPLRTFFFDAPWFGHGLGSFTHVLLRDSTITGRYSYEVQLLALPGQLGIVGLGLLCLLGIFYYRRLLWNAVLSWPDRLAIFALLLFWLGAGLANPLLTTPVAGVNYAALAALCGIASRPSRNPHHVDTQDTL